MLLPLRVAKLVVQISLLQHFRQNFLAGIAGIGLISRTLYQKKVITKLSCFCRKLFSFRSNYDLLLFDKRLFCLLYLEISRRCTIDISRSSRLNKLNSVRMSILCVPFRSATIVKIGKTMTFLPRFGGNR